MKATAFLKLAFLCLPAIVTIAPARAERTDKKTDWINFGFYEQSDSALSQTCDSCRVVFLGNSITQFWFERRPDFVAAHPNYVGRGISGQTTYQFLGRFREDVINLKPAVVVINAATNDIAENTHAYNERRTLGNIISLVELAEVNGISVILTSTLPASGFYWNPGISGIADKITGLNKKLRQFAADNSLPFVDYYSAMVAEDGSGAMNAGYSEDGVHPNAAGYEVMERLIVPVVHDALEQRRQTTCDTTVSAPCRR